MHEFKIFFFFFNAEFQTNSPLPLFFERQGIAARLEMLCHSEGQNRTRSPECLMNSPYLWIGYFPSNINGLRVHFFFYNLSKLFKNFIRNN